MRLTPAVRRWAIVAACTLGAACGGGSSPRPQPVPPAARVVLDTEAGTLDLVTLGCETVDAPRMVAEINGVAHRAAKANPALKGVSLAGWTLVARTPEATRQRCAGSDGAACIDAGQRQMHVWCDGGGVEHETGHAIAYAGGLPCWRRVGHDRDLTCRRTR